jgi:RNA polymerase sigma factor (sigma-70 family)
MAPGTLDVERIYREHGHVVVRRARQILGDESEAREVLQEIFCSLLDRPDQFSGRSSVTTFLYAMTTNACLTRLRNGRRRLGLLERHHEEQGARTEASAESLVAVRQLLASLPERLARVAVHFFVDEMTHEEIGELLGLSRRHVGNLVDRVLEEARRSARAA